MFFLLLFFFFESSGYEALTRIKSNTCTRLHYKLSHERVVSNKQRPVPAGRSWGFFFFFRASTRRDREV